MTLDPVPVTAAAQDAALGLMTDTCVIDRVGEVITSDDGADTPAVDQVYAGPCRVKPITSRAHGGQDPGPAPTGDWLYTVSIPMTEDNPQYGDRLTVTGSVDPSMAGVVMQIRSVDRGSQISARRMRCAEVSR